MIERVGDIVIVGTAHISARSVEEVEATIRETKPDKVLVELDPRRLEALQDPDAWEGTDIIEVLRQKKQHLFLLQLYLANMQARMGKETGIAPGGEMLRAIEVADEIGAEVVLIDRDVGITMRRGFGSMGFFQRLKLFWNVWMEFLTPAKAEEPLNVDDLLETDAITAMTEDFAKYAPSVKEALIDERDAYMASHIDDVRNAGQSAVAVVGAGHVPGMLRHLEGTPPARKPLEEEPPKRLTAGKVLSYAIPLAIISVFVYLGITGRYADLLELGLFWILINGGLSALGAALALGHPLSILVAFIAAPLTSLNPALAAGWFAGATEAKVRTPTVGDFQQVKTVETLGAFWRNGVVRVILVTALANLGSVAGTWIAGAKIVEAFL